MDLLSQYKEQHPEAFQPKKAEPIGDDGSEYGFFVRFLMKSSGGRIRTARQANYILLGFVCMALIWTAYYLFG